MVTQNKSECYAFGSVWVTGVVVSAERRLSFHFVALSTEFPFEGFGGKGSRWNFGNILSLDAHV